MGHRLFCVGILVATQLLAGCGQKGPLYRDTGQATAPVTQVSPAEADSQDDDEQRRSGS